jgi:hypothetical protein
MGGSVSNRHKKRTDINNWNQSNILSDDHNYFAQHCLLYSGKYSILRSAVIGFAIIHRIL